MIFEVVLRLPLVVATAKWPIRNLLYREVHQDTQLTYRKALLMEPCLTPSNRELPVVGDSLISTYILLTIEHKDRSFRNI